MIARKIWALENRKRYVCKSCGYQTHNRCLFVRHKLTLKHWLLDVFSKQAPRDIKVMVASFLPYYKIKYCGKLARDAFNMKLPPNSMWRITGAPAGLPAQNGAVVIRLIHNSQTQVYASLLL